MFSINASIKSQFAFTIRTTGRSKSRSVCCSNNNRSSGDGKQQKLEEEEEDWVRSPATASPYKILGVDPASSPSAAQLKAAFRARVKQFHPDVCKPYISNSQQIIQYVIRAYQTLSKHHRPHQDANDVCLDPFEEPESEACDLFVNEILCMGKGCPYSCVRRAPYAFSFTAENGTARATSQGHGDDYQVQLAVGQCPKRCIHYVTPLQRALMEDLLHSVLDNPYNIGDSALLESLIVQATLKNNRYQKPNTDRRQTKSSSEYVDWC